MNGRKYKNQKVHISVVIFSLTRHMMSGILCLNIAISHHSNSSVDGYTDVSNDIMTNNMMISL